MHIRRLLTSFFAIAAALFLALPASHSPVSAAGASWQVSAGSGTPDNAVTGMSFYPAVITIDEGDSVTWTAAGDAHTVTFLAGKTQPSPLDPSAETPIGGTTYDGTSEVSSGILTPHSTYTLTFPKAGTYPYVCLFHPGMVGTVVVQPAGTPYPLTQADYNEQATVTSEVDLGQGNALRIKLQSAAPSTTTNADGSTNYNVEAGASAGRAAIMRFLPGKLTIHVGDTVTWTNADMMEPHTVTFSPTGQYPEFPSGPAIAPAGGTTYDGTTFTNSGLIMPMGSPAIPGVPTVQTYTLKFTKAGTYTYHCLIHDDLGMIGKIRVVPAGTTPTLTPLVKVSYNQALGPILTDANGHTLYYLTSEIGDNATSCVAACLQHWFPLTVPSITSDAVEGPGVSGVLEPNLRADGIIQVSYGEEPLYTFAGDTAPGQIKGEGIHAFGGVWLAAQVTGSVLSAPLATAQANGGSSGSFTVSFSSTTAGTGMVEFAPGTSCTGLVETATQDLGAGTTSHTIQVKGNDMPGTVGDNGIQPGVTYSYKVVTVTSTGQQVDDNNGACYTVTIPTS